MTNTRTKDDINTLDYMEIPYNYKWYHGGIMSDFHTDLYNQWSKEIAELELTGFNTDHLERLHNARHRLVEHYLPA